MEYLTDSQAELLCPGSLPPPTQTALLDIPMGKKGNPQEWENGYVDKAPDSLDRCASKPSKLWKLRQAILGANWLPRQAKSASPGCSKRICLNKCSEERLRETLLAFPNRHTCSMCTLEYMPTLYTNPT